MTGVTVTGALLSIVAGVLLYVAAPNQKLFKAPWRLGWLPGLICSGAAIFCLSRVMGSGTSVFIVATALMLILTLLPFAATFLIRKAD